MKLETYLLRSGTARFWPIGRCGRSGGRRIFDLGATARALARVRPVTVVILEGAAEDLEFRRRVRFKVMVRRI